MSKTELESSNSNQSILLQSVNVQMDELDDLDLDTLHTPGH